MSDMLNQLLKRCLLDLESLKTLVQTVLPAEDDSPRAATWKSAKAVLTADKLKLYREHLESAKLTLILAHGYVGTRFLLRAASPN